MLDASSALLTGKVAIVTGGGGGIGKAISLAFAACGAKVVVAERDIVRASETLAEIQQWGGGQAIASVVDVQKKDQVETMVENAFSAYGQVDIMVNNVGDFLQIKKDFVDTTEDEWEALYHVNLKHVFFCTHAILPKMIAQGTCGSIINVSTVEAFRAIPGAAVYSAFKGAVTQFTKSVAIEVACHRIRVNAIAPDVTQTIQVPYDKLIPEEDRHMIPVWVPLGRFGMPDDMAGVAVFLASDLSRFVTGTTVHADGGTYAAGGWYRTDRGGWTNKPLKP